MYIINKQKDGDGFFHIHKSICSYKPQKNYLTCDGTISDAARVLGVSKSLVRKCSKCF